MASENIIEINTGNFEEKVLKNTGTVLVDFWAEWCGPCKQLSPLLDAIAKEHAGKVTIGKVNVDKSSDLAAQFQITAIPTIIIFQGGKIKDHAVGLASKKDLERKLGLIA